MVVRSPFEVMCSSPKPLLRSVRRRLRTTLDMPLPLRTHPRHAVLALVLVLVLAPTALGTTLVARPLDAMIREADAVALVTTADPLAARTHWIEGRIVTDLDISVVETLRGDLPVGPLTLRLPGGTVGAITQRLPGAPTFSAAGSWIVLLRRLPDGAYTVFDLCLGQLPIVLDRVTRESLVRPPATADVTLITDPRAAPLAVVTSTALQEIPAAGMPFERFAALVRSLSK